VRHQSLLINATGSICVAAVLWAAVLAPGQAAWASGARAESLPRTADGRPNLQGIWQVRNRAAENLLGRAARDHQPNARSVVEGDVIPYQPEAAKQQLANHVNRAGADPLGKCYLPGVPRSMYLAYPFHIFQTHDHVAMTFAWSQVFRLIYTDGKPPLHPGIESWMGDSRGQWAGDTLVVEVTGQNGNTWFDQAGNFHSDALRVTEKYSLVDADTIRYEATINDPKVFTRPWKLAMPLHRQKKLTRLPEYQCQAELEEASGAFERDPRTWYPGGRR
jgi:hypothetical protein